MAMFPSILGVLQSQRWVCTNPLLLPMDDTGDITLDQRYADTDVWCGATDHTCLYYTVVIICRSLMCQTHSTERILLGFTFSNSAGGTCRPLIFGEICKPAFVSAVNSLCDSSLNSNFALIRLGENLLLGRGVLRASDQKPTAFLKVSVCPRHLLLLNSHGNSP